MSTNIKNKFQKGFTLLESMIVLTIMGLMLAGLTLAFEVYRAEQTEVKMDKTYDSVRSAMNAFITERDGANLRARYPCPAPLNVGPDNFEFGVEQRNDPSGTPGDETCDATDDGSNGVYQIKDGGGTVIAYIGAIPTSTMSLTAEHMLDSYKNKMTYAVTASHIIDNALNFAPDGMVEIRDEAGNITNAPFAIVSHGPDGAGAYTIEGGMALPCRTTATSDGENCDFDDARFRESRTKMGSEATFYDDRLAFSLVDEDDDEWWAPFNDSPNDLRNKNPGIICIGETCDHNDARADDVMVVDGDLQITEDISVRLVSADGNVNSGANITANNNVTAGNDLSAGRDLLATRNAAIDGNVTTGGSVVAATNIQSLAGSVSAATTVTAGGNVTSGGTVSASGAVTAGGNVTSGGSVSATGAMTAGTSINAGGNMSAGGNVSASMNMNANGSMTAGSTVVAGTDVRAGGIVEANTDVISKTGNVESALDVIAGNNMDATHNATAAAFFYNGNGVVGSGGPSGTGGGGDSSSVVNVSCPEGKVLQSINNGSAVCVQNVYGGIYTENWDGSCRYGNPFLSGKSCSCPGGYSAKMMSEFYGGNGPTGHYCDAIGRSPCGVKTYQCIANDAAVGGGGTAPGGSSSGGDAGTGTSITDFSCPNNQYITGFDSEGAPICNRIIASPSVQAAIDTVASNCIDAANPTLSSNRPTDANKTIRFMSTCGKRWCTGLGYAGGRVIEKSASTAYMHCSGWLGPE